MFADEDGRQATLETYDDAVTPRSELVRTASHERRERSTILAVTTIEVAHIEALVNNTAVRPLSECWGLPIEEQGEFVRTMLREVREDLADRSESSDVDEFDSEAFGYDHGHLESERRFGYD